MADPLSQLAAPIGPQPPLVAAVTPAWSVEAAGLWGAGVVLLLAVSAVAWWWWRRRWLRGLARTAKVAHARHAVETAEALAALARRHQVQAPPEWWSALDRLRFGRPEADDRDVLQRLLLQARGFVPRDRLLARAPLRPLRPPGVAWRTLVTRWRS